MLLDCVETLVTSLMGTVVRTEEGRQNRFSKISLMKRYKKIFSDFKMDPMKLHRFFGVKGLDVNGFNFYIVLEN